MLIAANLFAQSIMTNTIDECIILTQNSFHPYSYMGDLSYDYNVRINVEYSEKDILSLTNDIININIPNRTMVSKITTFFPRGQFFLKSTIVFNAVLGDMFESGMRNMTNLTWRCDDLSSTIYIYPETNAISMLKIGPVDFNETPIGDLFLSADLLGLQKHGFKMQKYTLYEFARHTVSFKSDDAYLWEILDAIIDQNHLIKSWTISQIQNGYSLILNDFSYDGYKKRRIDLIKTGLPRK